MQGIPTSSFQSYSRHYHPFFSVISRVLPPFFSVRCRTFPLVTFSHIRALPSFFSVIFREFTSRIPYIKGSRESKTHALPSSLHLTSAYPYFHISSFACATDRNTAPDIKQSTALIAVMLSSTRIPNSVYNTLPAIETQSPPPPNVLQDIGRLFVNHGVNKDVGIALLHRHFELDNGEVMVHDGLRCSATLPRYVQPLVLLSSAIERLVSILICIRIIVPPMRSSWAMPSFCGTMNSKLLNTSMRNPSTWAPISFAICESFFSTTSSRTALLFPSLTKSTQSWWNIVRMIKRMFVRLLMKRSFWRKPLNGGLTESMILLFPSLSVAVLALSPSFISQKAWRLSDKLPYDER